MAIQTPLTQEQLIAQSLGQAAAGGMPPGFRPGPGAGLGLGPGAGAGGIPGQGPMPFAPTGLPGTPAIDPQAISQALAGGTPPINPSLLAGGSADVLAGPGSFADYLKQMRDYKVCVMQGGSNCVAPQQPGTPGVPPASGPVGI